MVNILDSVFVYRLSGGNRLSWHGRYHAHGAGEYEIHFFLEGNGSFLCNRTRYPVSSGRLYLSGPREFHSLLPETVSVPLTYYAILFSLDVSPDSVDAPLYAALNSCLANRQTVLSINTNFRFQFEDVLQMSRSSDVSLQDSAQHLLTSFLYRWFGRGELRRDTVARVGTNQVHVEKALSIMQKMVRENTTVEEIARKVGISEEHFIRVFRDEVRMTPYQYFTRLKVEGASGMLMSTDKLVGEISAWFGFENQFHFSRIFKKCTGMPPVEYRKTYLQIADFT
ncbi:MAG TPA: AraC family transcriptional regulator [Treponema sp.]|nr:AraC family transcriptional regulator [Treponema sp.]